MFALVAFVPVKSSVMFKDDKKSVVCEDNAFFSGSWLVGVATWATRWEFV